MNSSRRSSFVAGRAAALALTLASCSDLPPAQEPDRDAVARAALSAVSQQVLSARSVVGDPVPWAPLSGDRLRLEGEDGSSEFLLRPGPDGLDLVCLGPGGERVVATGVRPLTLGEEPNGMDDNGNGLIDEPGFCVVRDRNSLSIWLSLVSHDGDEGPCVQTRITLPG